MSNPKVLSFYLPQFHPFPENDLWWGTGFTEWSNVASARPRFLGHYQPHIPTELGFYDLRLAETRHQQAKLAKEHLIHGFCYYHYWFSGKRLMEVPIDQMIRSKEPDFPFCFCWANESWTRAWDGQERELLAKQEYSDADTLNHFEFLRPIFQDSRYIKIDGRPLFAVYRPDSIPNVRQSIKVWRDLAKSSGFPDLFLCGVKSGLVNFTESQILSCGFDAVIDFQPNRDFFPKGGITNSILDAARKCLPNSLYQILKRKGSAIKKVSYSNFVRGQLQRNHWKNSLVYPSVFPSWDNTARRKTPTIIENHSGEEFATWLRHALKMSMESNPSNPIVFVNAWNEWAEGCNLEPDKRHGRVFLEAIQKELLGFKGENS